jgi:hypothetical protein
MADDLEPFERLKKHILNLGYTVLAQGWLRRRQLRETVRQKLVDQVVLARLSTIYTEEVVPGFLCTTWATRPLDMCNNDRTVREPLFKPPYVGYRVEPPR